MTTINNLTIEQMRVIVSGAPEGASHLRRGIYFKYRNPVEWHYWEENQWKFTSSDITNSVFLIDLNDLRTAIAEHDTDHVTDIRNHVSPSTVVTDLHVKETDKLNRLGV